MMTTCPSCERAGGAVHVTLMLPVAAHPVPGSPSLTVTERVAVPAAPQVKIGEADAALSSVPPMAVQWYERGEGPWSESCAVAVSAMVPPTRVSEGAVPSPSRTGHTLRV